MNCHCKWLSAFLMVWETFLNFFCLLWSFGFTRIKLYPLSGEILYHDSVSVIVLRFTFLVEDLVICWYHITKLFCLRYCFASASSARCPRGLGSLADFALSVLWEVNINTVLFWVSLLQDVPNLSHEKCVRVQALLCFWDFLWSPLTIPEGLADVRPGLDCYPSFYLCFEFLVTLASFLVPHRDFALLLDLTMQLVSPAVAM